jgi:uncharacterized Tic20 family protein
VSGLPLIYRQASIIKVQLRGYAHWLRAMIVLTFVPFVHIGYAACKVSQGVDYRYPWVADLLEGEHSPGTP